MPDHRFRVGQSVRLTSWSRHSVGPREIFRVVATLPEQYNLCQYRIRSDNERHERVVTEDVLERIDMPSSAVFQKA